MTDVVGHVGEVGVTGEGRVVVPFGEFAAIPLKEELPTGTVVMVLDGSVTELARADSALASVYRLAAQEGLRLAFPRPVFDEAASLDEGTDDPCLMDLTDLAFVTIDYETSRDLDQALFIDRQGQSYVLYYALADASFFVEPESAIFSEAALRGTSFYLPGLTVPMLPRRLCEGIVSLNPNVVRRALTFKIELGADGRVRHSEVFRARILSRAKLSYAGVQAYLDGSRRGCLVSTEVSRSLGHLTSLGRLRIALAAERDVVRYDRVSVELDVSDDGNFLTMRSRERLDVEQYNEQISLLCNIEGARILMAEKGATDGVQGIFRVHPSPEPARLDELASSITELVDALGLSRSKWAWRRGQPDNESLADYIARLPDSGDHKRMAKALQRQAMLVGQSSSYTLEPGPHYGIGAGAYSRFSAPMREMVGVLTQRLALAQAGEGTFAIGREVVERAVEVANEAKLLQKRVTKLANGLALDQLFRADLAADRSRRPLRVGTIMGMTRGKVYVQLDDPPVDVKVYVDDLERRWGGRASLGRKGFELVLGQYRWTVGSAMALRTAGYDTHQRRWLFDVVDV